MTGSKGRAPIISLGDDFGTAVVQGGGTTVELSDNGDVTVHTNGNVTLRPAGNDNAKSAAVTEPQIGDVMPAGHKHAGWIYMGTDGMAGEVFYAAPKDESGEFTFNEAAKHAESVGAKVPSLSQLDKMYMSRDKGALKGTFNLTGSYPAGRYWSSRDLNCEQASATWFHRGYDTEVSKNSPSSLRCVR